ncbi:MAG: hypothetical protein ACP5H7_00065 [Minisyncoccia bacterium]
MREKEHKNQEEFEREKTDLEKIKEKIAEIKEKKLLEEEKMIKENIEKQISQFKPSPKIEKISQQKWEKIKDLDIEKKIFELLKIAENKGISFAVNIAQKSKDPYLLDLFHDILAKNEYYKNFPL